MRASRKGALNKGCWGTSDISGLSFSSDFLPFLVVFLWKMVFFLFLRLKINSLWKKRRKEKKKNNRSSWRHQREAQNMAANKRTQYKMLQLATHFQILPSISTSKPLPPRPVIKSILTFSPWPPQRPQLKIYSVQPDGRCHLSDQEAESPFY